MSSMAGTIFNLIYATQKKSAEMTPALAALEKNINNAA